MICEKCGNEVKPGDLFCGKCGALIKLGGNVDNSTKKESKFDNLKGTIQDTINIFSEKMQAKENKGDFKISLNKKTGIIAGSVALILIILILSFDSISNFYAKTFMSSEKYFEHVEEDNISGAISTVASIYGNVREQGTTFLNSEHSISIETALCDEAYDLIEMLIPQDVEWLKNISLSGKYAFKGSLFEVSFKVLINKQQVFDFDFIWDISEETIWVQVAELSKKYLGIELDDLERMLFINTGDGKGTLEELKIYEAVFKSLPEAKVLKKLADKYYGIIMSNMSDVEESKGVLEVEGISQKCTVLEVTIDDDCMRDIMEDVLKELRKDKEVKKIIQKMVTTLEENNLIDADKDEVYEVFCEQIDRMIKDVDNINWNGEEFVYTIWVSADGEIRGRSLESNGIEIAWLMPRDGNKAGTEIYVEEDNGNGYTNYIGIVGTGNYSGSKLSGTYNVCYGDYWNEKSEMLEVIVDDFNTTALENGKLNGRFKVCLSNASCAAMGFPSMVSKYAIDWEIKADDDSSSSNVAFTYKDEYIVKVAVDSSSKKATQLSAPTGKNTVMITDAGDVMEWLESVDWKTLLKNLAKANVPEEYIDIIEIIINTYL